MQLGRLNEQPIHGAEADTDLVGTLKTIAYDSRNAIDAVGEYVRQSAQDNRNASAVHYTELDIPTGVLQVAEAKQVLHQMNAELDDAPADRPVRFRSQE